MSRILLPISEVKITRERFRPVKGKVEEIAQSLLEFGQLQPVVLDADKELIDGAHRYEALRMNGATHIWVDFQDVDEIRAREIEVEANVMRLDMTPVEVVRATAAIHRLKSAADPNWSMPLTAQLTGQHQSQVADAVKLDKMLNLFPELGEAKSIRQLKSWADAKAASVTRVHDVKSNAIDYSAIESKILLGDSVEVIKTIPSESFHAVITDPPFGLDYDDRKSGTSGSLTGYEDSEAAYERLLTMAPDLFRVLKPNGWLVWFFGISWYERCKTAFREAGFIVDEIPVIWDRSEGKCHTNRPDRYFTRGYDVALHCLKGDAQIVQRGKSNVIKVKPIDNAARVTLVERPMELYGELIRRLTVPGEIVADFFVGGGGCPAAAASLGRDYFGVELSPERRAYAIQKIRGNTPDQEV